jgi:hypothetical protein
VELAIQRYKQIFGNVMRARMLPQQETEAWVASAVFNRMTSFGMPVLEKA